jgi:carbon storage regulator
MLVLTRKVGERIRVGDDVVITVVRINGTAVRLGVEAPPHLIIARTELAERNLAENAEEPATAGS